MKKIVFMVLCAVLFSFNVATSMCLKGNCVNGEGIYIDDYDTFNVYDGTWKNSQLINTRRVFFILHGAIYEGDIINSRFYHGDAVLIFKDGTRIKSRFDRGRLEAIENGDDYLYWIWQRQDISEKRFYTEIAHIYRKYGFIDEADVFQKIADGTKYINPGPVPLAEYYLGNHVESNIPNFLRVDSIDNKAEEEIEDIVRYVKTPEPIQQRSVVPDKYDNNKVYYYVTFKSGSTQIATRYNKIDRNRVKLNSFSTPFMSSIRKTRDIASVVKKYGSELNSIYKREKEVLASYKEELAQCRVTYGICIGNAPPPDGIDIKSVDAYGNPFDLCGTVYETRNGKAYPLSKKEGARRVAEINKKGEKDREPIPQGPGPSSRHIINCKRTLDNCYTRYGAKPHNPTGPYSELYDKHLYK